MSSRRILTAGLVALIGILSSACVLKDKPPEEPVPVTVEPAPTTAPETEEPVATTAPVTEEPREADAPGGPSDRGWLVDSRGDPVGPAVTEPPVPTTEAPSDCIPHTAYRGTENERTGCRGTDGQLTIPETEEPSAS